LLNNIDILVIFKDDGWGMLRKFYATTTCG